MKHRLVWVMFDILFWFPVNRLELWNNGFKIVIEMINFILANECVKGYNINISARARNWWRERLMSVTIKQIAELAGVSRGTVDRVLNARGGVNAEVEKRIQAIVKELSYEPNLVAKALANSKNRITIGVLINAGGNSFFDKVLVGIKRAQREVGGYGVSVIFEELTGYDVDEQVLSIEKLMKLSVQGLVITPINDKKVVKKLQEAARLGIVITTLNTDVTGLDKLCFVGCDYIKSGKTAAELLGQFSNGNTKVGIITGSRKMLGHNRRVDGFKMVLEKEYPNSSIIEVVENNDDNSLSYEVTKQLLTKHTLDALYFCAGGIDGGIQAVVELSREDMIIITVDDTQNIKTYITDGIVNATVCQQPIKQGYDAVIAQYEYLVNGNKPSKKHLMTQNEVKLKYNL